MIHDGKAVCFLHGKEPLDVRYWWDWQEGKNYTLPIGAVNENPSKVDGVIEADRFEVINAAINKKTT